MRSRRNASWSVLAHAARRLAPGPALGAGLLVVLASGWAGAAGAALEVQILPATLQLAPGETADVVVVARNGSPADLRDCTLAWWSVASATLDGGGPAGLALAPGEALAWPARVRRDPTGSATGQLGVRLECRASDGAKREPATHVLATGSVDVQPRAIETLDALAEINLETALQQIDEHHAGQVLLIVRNKSDRPLELTGIAAYGPPFVRFELPDWRAPAPLEPRASRVITVPVAVADTVHTGDHRLLFEVAAKWETAGGTGTGSLVAAHTVKVNVLGEAALLQLVGLPSLLFLPGFLMLSSFTLLWTRAWPRRAAQAGLSAAEFTLLSVTLSLLAALVYPSLSDVFGRRRDYLRGYGLVDVFSVWFGSVLAGLAAWVGVVGVLDLRRRWGARQAAQREAQADAERRRRTPAPGDTPLEILDKLALNGLGLPLLVTVDLGGHVEECFSLMEDDATPPGTWVAPPFVVHEKASLARGWETRLEQSGSPAALAQALRGEGLAVAWTRRGAIKGPLRVEPDAVKRAAAGAPRLFFEVAAEV